MRLTSVSFALLTASSSVSNVFTTATGPKISSLEILALSATSVNTVGLIKYPYTIISLCACITCSGKNPPVHPPHFPQTPPSPPPSPPRDTP